MIIKINIGKILVVNISQCISSCQYATSKWKLEFYESWAKDNLLIQDHISPSICQLTWWCQVSLGCTNAQIRTFLYFLLMMLLSSKHLYKYTVCAHTHAPRASVKTLHWMHTKQSRDYCSKNNFN